jgi:CheY-like chemotaxis protein
MARVALVVDDSMLIRHTVCRFLEERGFAVESATNGQEALEILKTVLPDLIITDMQMPKMGGNELITSLKASLQTANIPIVVLQGRKTSGDTSTETRANYIIYKDIEIVAQLERALVVALGEGMLES